MKPADLEEIYPLSPEQIAFYQANGFIKLKQVLSAETLAYYRDLITEWVFKLNTLVKPMEERTTYERAFLQIMNLWRENEEIKRFVFSPKLARIAAHLMGVSGVRLYHDQALYKESSGGITPWHADQFYWPLASDKTCTVWIPLQETLMPMGPLAFAIQSQHATFGRDLAISDESEAILAEAMEKYPIEESPFDLGEVSFHSGWTYHRAGANSSGVPRKVMTMIYMDKDIRVAPPANAFQENDWVTWLDRTPVGEVADGALNPILWEE